MEHEMQDYFRFVPRDGQRVMLTDSDSVVKFMGTVHLAKEYSLELDDGFVLNPMYPTMRLFNLSYVMGYALGAGLEIHEVGTAV